MLVYEKKDSLTVEKTFEKTHKNFSVTVKTVFISSVREYKYMTTTLTFIGVGKTYFYNVRVFYQYKFNY